MITKSLIEDEGRINIFSFKVGQVLDNGDLKVTSVIAGGHVSGNVMMYYRKSAQADAINLAPYVSGNQVYFYQTRDGYADVWAEILFDLTGASTNFYMYASVVYETAS